jgi:cell pole-organizing protein PopZ
MPTPSAQQEPTMEEILASIRRIISEDADPGKTPTAATTSRDGDVLELTNVVHDDGTIGGRPEPAPMAAPEPLRRRTAAPPPRAEPAPIREPAPEPRVSRRAPPPEPRHMRNPSDLDMVEKDDRDGVLSSQASSAISNAFGQLTRERDVSVGGGTTLEDIVAQMMKPMLAAWLDEHLPEIVERVVQQEVERAARGGRRR